MKTLRFTRYHSLNDILEYPGMKEYLKIFYSEFLLEIFPEKMEDEPLVLLERFGKTPVETAPWGEPFSVIVDQFMDAANLILDITENKTKRCIMLWDENNRDWSLEAEKEGGKKQVFLLASETTYLERGREKKPAVIICPGGGYEQICFRNEGTPIMHFMETKGYCAFVLKYRVFPEIYPAPQEDLEKAIRYVREHAEEYGIDANNITLIGFSAGGHLCATETALFDEKPDKLVLCYPVISFQKNQHEGSFQALTGGVEKLRKILSVEELVTKDFPPTFVWACEDDICVSPENAKYMAKELKKRDVNYEYHIYPKGGHGCGLAFSNSAYRWSRAMIDFLEQQ